MKPQLTLYSDGEGNLFIAIVTDPEWEKRFLNRPFMWMEKKESIPIEGDLGMWPVNLLYGEEMNLN